MAEENGIGFAINFLSFIGHYFDIVPADVLQKGGILHPATITWWKLHPPVSNSNLEQQVLENQRRNRKSEKKFGWRKVEIEKVDLSWKGEPRQVPGILETPLKYFQTFFDDELLELIVEQSNLFALQTEGCNLCLTVEQLKVFMSIILLLGVIRVPYYRMHWEAASRYPQIAEKMGRQTFDKIKRFLHFNENYKAKKPGEQGSDKLYKIRPVLGNIRSKFL
ncbi:hypothetical protein QYM36_012403 [Artemia franciscana]|uniref:PiggyBac transposable element-derived protein domain-containing protein n=1 Tax=Artemia franciscana TaxID=6661 RepID=A0AA88HUJ2_ARTSF|nr:hypothetical protein QYM36_012403 [Artemia franciscana]